MHPLLALRFAVNSADGAHDDFPLKADAGSHLVPFQLIT
jgi:hypothetical protein